MHSIQPWIVVDPDSGWVSRAPPYSGFRLVEGHAGYATITLFGAPSQTLPLIPSSRSAVLQPRFITVWAPPRSLAAT